MQGNPVSLLAKDSLLLLGSARRAARWLLVLLAFAAGLPTLRAQVAPPEPEPRLRPFSYASSYETEEFYLPELPDLDPEELRTFQTYSLRRGSKSWSLSGPGSEGENYEGFNWFGDVISRYYAATFWNDPGFPFTRPGSNYWISGWLGSEYGETNPLTAPIQIPFEYRVGRSDGLVPGFPDWYRISTYEARIDLLLHPGGWPGSKATNLFVFTGVFTNQQTGAAIKPNVFSVLGRPFDLSGRAWVGVRDNVSVFATPRLIHAPPSASYGFTLDFVKARLKINFRGTNIAGTTQTVWVGEQIALACELDPPIAPLTNFLWTIPGQKVAGYGTTNAENLTMFITPLGIFTNQGISFHWVGGTNATVVCQAMVAGQRLSASARFDVRRPTVDFFGILNAPVGIYGPPVQLAFGDLLTPGIYFSYSGLALMGFTNDYRMLFVQTGWSLSRWNSFPLVSINRFGYGLDDGSPYAAVTNQTNGTTADSPTLHLEPYMVKAYRSNGLKMYLMFQPMTAGSIPVPLRRVDWTWAGIATSRPPGG